jgi:hypothetical protein
MTSALGVLPALLLMVVLLGVPPMLCMLSCARRASRMRARLRPDQIYRFGALASAGAFMFNMFVLLPTTSALASGGAQITLAHWFGLALSWICFWAWIVVSVTGRRRRRTVY